MCVTAAPFVVATAQEQLKCPLPVEWIKPWYIHTPGNYAKMKINTTTGQSVDGCHRCHAERAGHKKGTHCHTPIFIKFKKGKRNRVLATRFGVTVLEGRPTGGPEERQCFTVCSSCENQFSCIGICALLGTCYVRSFALIFFFFNSYLRMCFYWFWEKGKGREKHRPGAARDRTWNPRCTGRRSNPLSRGRRAPPLSFPMVVAHPHVTGVARTFPPENCKDVKVIPCHVRTRHIIVLKIM